MHFFGSLTPSAANERASKLSHRPSGSPQAITLLVSFADAQSTRQPNEQTDSIEIPTDKPDLYMREGETENVLMFWAPSPQKKSDMRK